MPVEPRMNVLVITCHDLGDYLGCYGTPVATPNLDALAEQGVVFLNHFSTGTVCSPARGSITTGCYPHTHGLMGLVHRGWSLNVDRCPPLAAWLGRAGFQTHLFGFQHEHYDATRLGYQQVHKTATHHAADVASSLEKWLLARRDNRPFLAAAGFSEAHRMGMSPSHFRHRDYPAVAPADVVVRPYLPDIPEVRDDLAGFYGAVQYADAAVGRILEALERTGQAQNTLVVFTTDHGASFMHSKGTLYDGGTKVACLMRGGAALPRGRRCTDLTSHVDIVPTVLDVLGVPAPAGIQGLSQRAVLRGEAPARPCVFAERNYTNYYDPGRMVRSADFKYIRKGLRTSIFDFLVPELELCEAGFRVNRKVFEFYSARRTSEALYDLRADPAEMHNVIDRPEYAAPLAQLRAALAAHLEATDDPFRHLRNDLLMPEGDYEAVRDWKGP